SAELALRLRREGAPEVVEAVAERAAVIVLEQLAAPTSAESEFLTVSEAAAVLRCKPQRIYDLLSAGRLTRYKDGSRVLVRRADLVAHLMPTGARSRMGNGVGR